MATLIDDLYLSKSGRESCEEMLRTLPVKLSSFTWLNINDIKKGIEELVNEEDIKVVVATGGLEVYDPKEKDEFFVFDSPNHDIRSTGGVLNFEKYEQLINDPIAFHKNALDELSDFMSHFEKGSKVKIIEGDISNLGASITRLCAIYKTLKDYDAELVIGAAPEQDMFKIIKKTTLKLLSNQPTYKEDIRNSMGLRDISYKVVKKCSDFYIRRVSEVFPPITDEDEVNKILKHYVEQGIDKEKIKSFGRLHASLATQSNAVKEKLKEKYKTNKKRLDIKTVQSLGLLLSYHCASQCRHCMYASSPKRKSWMTEKDIRHYFNEIKSVNPSASVHLGGGEPFLKPELVLKAVKIAKEMDIKLDNVETNAFWCRDDDIVLKRFTELKEAGLESVLIGVSPFHNEKIPFAYTARAAIIGEKVFGEGLQVYTKPVFDILMSYHREKKSFGRLDLNEFVIWCGKTTAERKKLKVDKQEAVNLGIQFFGYLLGKLYSICVTGRAAYSPFVTVKKHGPSRFFGVDCAEVLTRSDHAHIDNEGNYITGMCAGISVGDSHDLKKIFEGVDLEKKPILKILANKGVEGLFNFAVDKYDYVPLEKGYANHCSLCVDIRKHIVERTDEFSELAPKEFYQHLDPEEELPRDNKTNDDLIKEVVQLALAYFGTGKQLSAEVINAMKKIDRASFSSAKSVYINHPVKIGHEQTCSQPSMVAFMADRLELKPGLNVLEIGTGCGYSAAITERLINPGKLTTIEIIEELAKLGKKNILSVNSDLGKRNIEFIVGNGYKGFEANAPYDRIYLTAGAQEGFDENAFKKQLKEGGILIYPQAKGCLYVLTLQNGELKGEGYEGASFVPLRES